MPTGSGQYQLQDYIAELQNRGFSGFTPADLTTLINRGYFAVAAKSKWYWEETSDPFTVTPPTFAVSVGEASTELPGMKSLDKVVVTTAGQTRVLSEMNEQVFIRDWLSGDPTLSQGEPSSYYLWNNQLWILPAPNSARTFLAYYHRDVVPLVNSTDAPFTPQKYDEVVFLEALKRCHLRALEYQLAEATQQELNVLYDDMRDEEETRVGEHLDRVQPDDTWL